MEQTKGEETRSKKRKEELQKGANVRLSTGKQLLMQFLNPKKFVFDTNSSCALYISSLRFEETQTRKELRDRGKELICGN